MRKVINRDICLVLAGKDETRMPNVWTQFLDILLSINKILHPERTQGTVFGSKDKREDPDSMDVDNSDVKRSKKGKGREANTTEANSNQKFCHICRRRSHNTDECFFNSKKKSDGKDVKPLDKLKDHTQASATSGKKEGKDTQQKKYKILRVVEVDSSNGEDNSTSNPTKASNKERSKEVSGLTVAHISDVETESEDEALIEKKATTHSNHLPDFVKRLL